MTVATDTVHARIERATAELTPARLATGIALVLAVGFLLMFVQEPLVHESLHNFRHVTGIACH